MMDYKMMLKEDCLKELTRRMELAKQSKGETMFFYAEANGFLSGLFWSGIITGDEYMDLGRQLGEYI